MSFAGVSIISDDQLLGRYTERPAIEGGAASGYHLLVVERHSRIKNPNEGSVLASHRFIVGGHRWCIVYYPGDFITLHLCLAERTANTVRAQFQFSFVAEAEKHEPARIHDTRVFEFRSYEPHGSDRFVSRDVLEKSRHLNGDSYTIRCDIMVAEEDVISPFIEVPPSEMKQNFADLLLAGEGTDVVFQVSGETFSAHRCILAARSAVFKALLFGPMKEGTSMDHVVQIHDMEATVFKALLGFVYGDSLPARPAGEEEHGTVLLQHLLVAADRYGLRRLRAMCEKRLCEDIGVGTATAILALAEQHHCEGLKVACYEFLRYPENLRETVATNGFEHLCRSCPPVMKDLILGMLQAPK